MISYKDITERKYKLLERYKAALQEEMLEELRAQALVEAEKDRFPWKGKFRSHEELSQMYQEYKRWDRRFLVDTALLALLLWGVVFSTPMLVATVAPRSSWIADNPRLAAQMAAEKEAAEAQPQQAPVEQAKEEN